MIDREFEQVMEAHVKKMQTKPEGPAPEPQCECGHNEATHAVQVSTSGSRLHGCYVCSDCDHFVPATPAPSQPAGAREWLQRNGPEWRTTYAADEVVKLLGDFAAAKDAAYERLAEATVADLKALKAEKEAAERERDSLRALLEHLNRRGGLGLDVHEEIDAALKAGKDGQQ